MSPYSKEEDYLIIKNYGKIPMTELMEMLPNRTEDSIRSRIRRLRGKTSSYKKKQKNNAPSEIRRTLIDSYSYELYHNFLQYVERARLLSSEQRTNPDVNNMIRVFREMNGRFISEDEIQLHENG